MNQNMKEIEKESHRITMQTLEDEINRLTELKAKPHYQQSYDAIRKINIGIRALEHNKRTLNKIYQLG